VPYVTILERCHIAWDGTLEEAKLYALPRVQTAIAEIVRPLREYIQIIDTVIRRVSLNYPTVFEWACLKRFQEAFSAAARPIDKLADFCDTSTEFGSLKEVKFTCSEHPLPKITRARRVLQASRGRTRAANEPDISLLDKTANPLDWPKLMDKMIDLAWAIEPGVGVCFKPLPQSSSSDLILMLHFSSKAKKAKASEDPTALPATLTLGLAVKNYGTSTRFGQTHFDDECIKFDRMFDGLSAKTETKFGTMTNILIICATNYDDDFTRKFATRGKRARRLFAAHRPSEYQHIDEVIQLDLTTEENRAKFFGFGDGESGLSTVVTELLRKSEREWTRLDAPYEAEDERS
jgi:hypothetical protein